MLFCCRFFGREPDSTFLSFFIPAMFGSKYLIILIINKLYLYLQHFLSFFGKNFSLTGCKRKVKFLYLFLILFYPFIPRLLPKYL
jgi:hypothetical protein